MRLLNFTKDWAPLTRVYVVSGLVRFTYDGPVVLHKKRFRGVSAAAVLVDINWAYNSTLTIWPEKCPDNVMIATSSGLRDK